MDNLRSGAVRVSQRSVRQPGPRVQPLLLLDLVEEFIYGLVTVIYSQRIALMTPLEWVLGVYGRWFSSAYTGLPEYFYQTVPVFATQPCQLASPIRVKAPPIPGVRILLHSSEHCLLQGLGFILMALKMLIELTHQKCCRGIRN